MRLQQKKIRSLAENKEALGHLEMNARICGEKHYSSAVNTLKYVNLLRKITKEHCNGGI